MFRFPEVIRIVHVHEIGPGLLAALAGTVVLVGLSILVAALIRKAP